MFRPDDPLAPPARWFEEPWQAQALALADSLVQAGRFSATDWGAALGTALKEAEARGAPDTLDGYYAAVLVALERLCETRAARLGLLDRRPERRAPVGRAEAPGLHQAVGERQRLRLPGLLEPPRRRGERVVRPEQGSAPRGRG